MKILIMSKLKDISSVFTFSFATRLQENVANTLATAIVVSDLISRVCDSPCDARF